MMKIWSCMGSSSLPMMLLMRYEELVSDLWFSSALVFSYFIIIIIIIIINIVIIIIIITVVVVVYYAEIFLLHAK